MLLKKSGWLTTTIIVDLLRICKELSMEVNHVEKSTTPWQEYQYSLTTVTSHECILCGTPQCFFYAYSCWEMCADKGHHIILVNRDRELDLSRIHTGGAIYDRAFPIGTGGRGWDARIPGTQC